MDNEQKLKMSLEQYINNVNKRYKQGNSTEHTFRGDLQQLIESLVSGIRATNEPQRQSCGAPDYILTRKDIPIGYIETKDIGDSDLDGVKATGNKEQFDRYKEKLENLIFTDYLDFHFYRDKQLVAKIAIAEMRNETIVPLINNFPTFLNLINNFCTFVGQTIKNPRKLAEMMASKAKLLSEVIEKALSSDESSQENSTLQDQMEGFKRVLIHDITPKGFADVYAQTIVYGMFAARLNDPTLPTFNRQEAAELIPKTNPFLRKLFSYIAGPDIDDRIKWIVDSLVGIFLASNIEEILKTYGKSTKTEDPIIHFYETFLSEYDPALRKARGVWYTPKPVVNFIVRAVDDILKTEFNLPQGLADTSKIKVRIKPEQKIDKRYKDNIKTEEKEFHKIQILDPGAGTGTFLAETIKLIHNKFEGQQGIWSNYVDNHLLTRLNGFEILMASYAMAHLKLDLLLKETGYISTTDQRLRVFLTNSLEEHHPDTGGLFASWLSNEANEANHVKRDTPVMVVMGNPPYSGISSNNGEWINNLINDYKYIDGEYFNERKHWLNDDYVKFIRYGQHFIEKNGSGVLAFINPHGFLDNPTFRGMRWNLLKTYDKIYTIDLHGNSKKKETAPDGSVDQNVFDIQQGVSINLFIKTGKKKNADLGKIFHYDLYGKREMKYDFLYDNSLKTVPFKELKPEKPFLFFVPKNNDGITEYENGFKVDALFSKNVTGIVTMGDNFILAYSKEILKRRLNDFIETQIPEDSLKKQYGLGKNYAKWVIGNKLKINIDDNNFVKISYRPFEDKWTYFDNKLIWRWRIEVMKHFLKGENIGLVMPKQVAEQESSGSFITKFISAHKLCSAYNINNVFPLYLYSENNEQPSLERTSTRTPNLNTEIVSQIAEKLRLNFTNEKETIKGTFAPIDLLDYIYAVLHSPNYREKYKEFLKTDFPKIPYPKNVETFWNLVKLGGEIREIHLLESPTVEKYITQYPVDGNNTVDKIKYNETNVYINETQYFANVPEAAWNFCIGGYQPAQKWLKDRKGRKLEFDDIQHYQKIIVALMETDKLMSEINKIELE